MVPPPGTAVTGRLTLLCAALRADGVRVGVGDLLGAHRALAAVDPASRLDAYHALRAALCSRHQDLAAFDAAWEHVFSKATQLPVPPEFADAMKLALPQIPSPDASRPPAE